MKNCAGTTNRILFALAVFALVAASQSAWADETQINFSGVQLGRSNLLAPLGQAASDSAEPVDQMAALVSDAPKGPFSISGGALSFSTTKATSVATTFSPAYFNYYATAGGTLTLTGSIFGLPDGSPLFTATFAAAIPPPFGATTTAFVDPTVDLIQFGGLLSITWVNPVLLSDLGADDVFGDQSFGSIGVTRFRSADTGSLDTSTAITLFLVPEETTPEPTTFVLLGTGLFAMASRWRAGSRRAAAVTLISGQVVQVNMGMDTERGKN